MARTVTTVETVTITDDLDQKEIPEDTQPTYFGWGGRRYEIYLSQGHHDALDKSLAKYIEAAKDVTTQARAQQSSGRRTAGASARPSAADREQLAAIRSWAQSNEKLLREHDLTVPGDRGRIAQGVQDLYHANN